MGIVLMLHALWRWVVVLVVVAALVKFGLGWLQRKQPDSLDRRLTLAFTTVIDIQVLLGLIVLIGQIISSTLSTAGIEHVVAMLIVAGVAHLTAMWRKRDDNTVLRNNFFVVLVVLVLIGVGVAVVGGWNFG